MTEIVKLKRDAKVQRSVLFLCTNYAKVKEGHEDIENLIKFYEQRAMLNVQCHLEKILDKTEFKLNLSSSELVSKPICPVTNEIHFDDYFASRIVITINRNSWNRVKIANSYSYKLIRDAFDGRLLTMNDFTHTLNT